MRPERRTDRVRRTRDDLPVEGAFKTGVPGNPVLFEEPLGGEVAPWGIVLVQRVDRDTRGGRACRLGERPGERRYRLNKRVEVVLVAEWVGEE